MNGYLKHWTRNALPPIVMFFVVLAVWQLVVVWRDLPIFLVPGPGQVIRAAISHRGQILESTWITFTAAAAGFSASVLTGMCVALVFSQSRAIRNSCYPYAIFLQTVPIVAIAPLIIIWFGYGFQSVVIIAGIISLFPIITNTTTGMLSVDNAQLDLFRLYNATRSQIVFKLRLPTAIPFVVAGARTSAGLAVVGAIVGEFFVGAGTGRFGLGYLIRQKMEHMKTDQLFAAVIASTLLGIAIFAAVNLIGATILARWDRPKQDRFPADIT